MATRFLIERWDSRWKSRASSKHFKARVPGSGEAILSCLSGQLLPSHSSGQTRAFRAELRRDLSDGISASLAATAVFHRDSGLVFSQSQTVSALVTVSGRGLLKTILQTGTQTKAPEVSGSHNVAVGGFRAATVRTLWPVPLPGAL